MDDEVREQLESLNRNRAWLIRATEKYPDLRVYRWGLEIRYCSASVNRIADEFELANFVERHLMPGQAPRESNLAVWCFTDYEGKRVHSWPPAFILGGVDDPGTTVEERRLHAHWSAQLREAQIPAALVRKIDEATSDLPIEDEDDDSWREGDEDFSVWSAQDSDGDVVGVVRVHDRMNHETLCALRTRADCLGIKIWSHDGGYTIRSARDLQAFIDDTVAFMAERAADREAEAETAEGSLEAA